MVIRSNYIIFAHDMSKSEEKRQQDIRSSLILPNDVQEVPRLAEFVDAACEAAGFDMSTTMQMNLAIEEAVVNVMDYAYPLGQEGDIEIRIMSDGKTLKTIIIDSGVAFDPTVKEKADTSLSAEDRQIGGLGILLVRELMDAINYERNNGKNVLTLIKNI